ncbi:MAG: ATP-dependent DNA helicase RecG, partial [Muribaculaceae bacterium]|nr:ATP-dependent DNA helicase RecG [Muribaculaceae bacterium]
MNSLRDIDVKFVKGIGPDRAKLLEKELGIRSVYDLLHHFPQSYADRSKIYRLCELSGEMPAVQMKGRFVSFTVQGEGAKTRLTALFSDGTGLIEVVWFRRVQQMKNA